MGEAPVACVADERPAGVVSEGGDGRRGGHGIRDGGPMTCEREASRGVAWHGDARVTLPMSARVTYEWVRPVALMAGVVLVSAPSRPLVGCAPWRRQAAGS